MDEQMNIKNGYCSALITIILDTTKTQKTITIEVRSSSINTPYNKIEQHSKEASIKVGYWILITIKTNDDHVAEILPNLKKISYTISLYS
jgi:hypothetical protein